MTKIKISKAHFQPTWLAQPHCATSLFLHYRHHGDCKGHPCLHTDSGMHSSPPTHTKMNIMFSFAGGTVHYVRLTLQRAWTHTHEYNLGDQRGTQNSHSLWTLHPGASYSARFCMEVEALLNGPHRSWQVGRDRTRLLLDTPEVHMQKDNTVAHHFGPAETAVSPSACFPSPCKT